MTRAQLEHLIRASADIAADDDIVVIGSQAILGQYPDAPEELCRSVEADVYPRNHPERADLIDGSIGEGSPFHATFGYYAQGVGEETAVLPLGWPGRLIPMRNENTRGATGWCLEVHDLVVSKCIAGREKDLRFLEAAARHRLIRHAVLIDRLAMIGCGGWPGHALTARSRPDRSARNTCERHRCPPPWPGSARDGGAEDLAPQTGPRLPWFSLTSSPGV